jgi:ADP-ribosylation factor GTPase-activating protein 1
MEIYSHKEIVSLLSIEGNDKCFDCGELSPTWTSINNGVFLCLKCAGVHRNFGLEISVIRSLQIDSWDDKQIMFLKKGGNYKYQEMLMEYNLSNVETIELKYKTKAADFYRKKLYQDVEKEMNPLYESEEINKPDISVGNEVLKEKEIQNEVTNNDIIGNTKKVNTTNHNEHQESFLGYIGGIFLGASKKVGELELNNKLYEAGKNVFDLAKKSGTYIAETTMQIYVSKYLI